ncbi:deoxyuridine 5-triphosphate nucleotidohydrolase [Stylonychia lemnae]|uniref:Deoxyuridine 5'-triphosphate nucleotidohydrolase n=1 Tax=Stylonychia lemnae TaxID=5949 RepID=A0A078ACC7_STYLE|nr:deoxyuridine 5-triphosphate nucleotidohydrolase [Stylonychia lemnae]|eukprot:CDW79864.1 deoxyuridine 5-triphosphate nucleotidohydrolase [Stylonychia lemnae]
MEETRKAVQREKLRIKKLDAKAFLPTKGSEHAAGYDLYSIEDTVVKSKDKKLISTGISMQIPVGNYGRVAPRSGLAVKNFIDVGAGVIDADYRGEVKVLLFNFGEQDFSINVGDRVAQLIIEKYTRTEIEEVPMDQDLDSTARGEGGFGSTGVKLDSNGTH